MHTCVRAPPALQIISTSVWHTARPWISIISLCSSAGGEEGFVCMPAKPKSDTYPAASASHWLCPQMIDHTALEKPCRLFAVVSQGESLMPRTDTLQLSRVGHPLCPSLRLSLSLCNFTAGAGPIESEVSCRYKQVYSPIDALLPCKYCKR